MNDEKTDDKNLDFACLDFGRLKRTGLPEVIFCRGKSLEQIVSITQTMFNAKENIIGTKAEPAVYY